MDPTLQALLNADMAASFSRNKNAFDQTNLVIVQSFVGDQRTLSAAWQNSLFQQNVLDSNTAAISPSTLPRPAPFTAAEGATAAGS
jgi:hypothetical protein